MSNYVIIDNIKRNISKRKYCLEYSPFNKHNTKQIEKIDTYNNGTKLCSKCKLTKPLSEFYKRHNNLYSYCKDCYKIKTQKRQRTFKASCVKYKGSKCEVCGLQDKPFMYDFHHINPKEKDFSLSRVKTSILSSKIINELDKCQLLCANCHRRIHSNY